MIYTYQETIKEQQDENMEYRQVEGDTIGGPASCIQWPYQYCYVDHS